MGDNATCVNRLAALVPLAVAARSLLSSPVREVIEATPLSASAALLSPSMLGTALTELAPGEADAREMADSAICVRRLAVFAPLTVAARSLLLTRVLKVIEATPLSAPAAQSSPSMLGTTLAHRAGTRRGRRLT